MVSVGKLSAGQARYYLDQAAGQVTAGTALTSGAEDYYLGGPQAAGRWLGRGARALGLEGKVTDGALHAVLAGRAPLTGELLRTRGTVAGFDVTFSAPKSVSVLFGIGDPTTRAAIHEAHTRAVTAAFAYFERSTAFARRGAGGSRTVRADGLVAAAFVHRTSRSGDPQLHTHVLVANMVRADGQWSALDGRLVYTHARTAGFLYQAALREELTRSLGVAWTPVTKGAAEITGVSSRVIKAFSRRRAEIEAAMDLHGSRGRHAAQVAALDTRRAKDRAVRPEELAPEWRHRAARLGLDSARISRLLDRPPTPTLTWQEAFDRLAAPTGLTQNQSTFTRRDVLQALCELAGQGASVHDLEHAADAFLASRSVVQLTAGSVQPEPRYSTVELLGTEQRAMSMAVALRDAGRGLATPHGLQAALEARPHLTDEQRVMVERLTQGGEGVVVIVGPAGTGKTTALAAARVAWEAAGLPVQGCAIARKAAHNLRHTAGIEATSVAALLRRPRPLEVGTVLVIDEGSMLGTRAFAELLRRVDDAQGKLVIAGDTHQLAAIEAGGVLGALVTRLRPIELHDNRRQQQAWEREAVKLLCDCQAEGALGLYERHDRLHIGHDGREVFRRMVSDWHATADPDGCLMIAHYRADVGELNGRARAVMRTAGRLGPDELVAAGSRFAAGDRVVVKLNSARHDVRNGERGAVEAVDLRSGSLSIRVDDRLVQLDTRFLASRTPGGRPSLEHGYAMTAHSAQGLTCRRSLVLARDDTYREWVYTAMTRATDANRLYVIADRNCGRDEFAPAEPARDGRALLVAALTRRRVEELALDQLRLRRQPDRGIER